MWTSQNSLKKIWSVNHSNRMVILFKSNKHPIRIQSLFDSNSIFFWLEHSRLGLSVDYNFYSNVHSNRWALAHFWELSFYSNGHLNVRSLGAFEMVYSKKGFTWIHHTCNISDICHSNRMITRIHCPSIIFSHKTFIRMLVH